MYVNTDEQNIILYRNNSKFENLLLIISNIKTFVFPFSGVKQFSFFGLHAMKNVKQWFNF